jgi:polyisoprenoid-binding protein YceI
MRKLFLTASVVSLIAAGAFAAAEWTPPSTSLEKVTSGAYALDTSHASIIFTIKHLGFSHYTGRFNDFDATLDLDAKDPTKSKLAVVIKADSTDTNNDHLEQKLDSPEFLNVVKFPEAKFVSTKIEKISETTGLITGDFTLMGVTKPLTLKATFNGGGFNPYAGANVLGFSAVGALKRSDFGFTAYAPAVSDDVKFYVEVEFNQPVKKVE